MSKTVIYTDESGFNRAVNLYSQKVQVKQNIRMEMKKLIPSFKVTDDFYKDVELNFYNALGEAHPKHLELMHPNKIPELLDLDIKLLQSLANEFDLVKHTKNPSISSYEVLAETLDAYKKFDVRMKAMSFFYSRPAIDMTVESTKYLEQELIVGAGEVVTDEQKRELYIKHGGDGTNHVDLPLFLD